ncbi:MAG: hypothetical protein ACP5H2_01160 [Solirubrobacteraceae bacterium]
MSTSPAVPELSLTGRTDAVSHLRFPQVALITALGLAMVCMVDDLSRATRDPSTAFYWLGVTLIVVPAVIRTLSDSVSRGEQVALVVTFGLAMLAVKVMRDPYAFTLSDEFPHAYNAQQVLIHHHLYTPNSFLPVTAEFPGLAGATSALAQLSGMSPFGSGIILLAAARTTFMLGLFALLLAVGGSSRAAGLGTLLYAADSNFMLWQAQYAYESLALPLLLVLMAVAVERSQRPVQGRKPWAIVLIVLIAALVPTHHLTSYAAVVILALLSITRLPRLRLTNDASTLPFAGVALVLAAAWLVVVASITVGYLTPVIAGALKSVFQTLTQEAPPHALFGKTSTESIPGNTLYEKALGGLSVLLAVSAVLLSLRRAWSQSPQHSAAKVMLVAAAVLYIPTMGLRFASGAWETSVRLVDFFSIGVAFVLGWFPVDQLANRTRPWIARATVATAAAIMVVGGAINGWPPASRIARPTSILADGKRLLSPSFAVGYWTKKLPRGIVLGPGSDIEPVLLFGDQPVASGATDAADEVLQMSTLPGWALPLWRSAHIRYVVVDLRADATSNTDGFYFATTPKGGYPEPLLSERLATRFDRAGLSRIYDSGNVFVYLLGSSA